MAATASLARQPSSPQTLYAITWARGAMPETLPRSMPRSVAGTLPLPAAVLEVCVPCPMSSRADVNEPTGIAHWPAPTQASYAAMKRYAPISLLLQVNAGPGLAPIPNWHGRGTPGGGYALPCGSGSENDGCSGHTPVSIMPTITPSPATSCPPSAFQAPWAPMNAGLRSVVGWCSSSGYTATTPGIAAIA